jgi:hypothetical protein
MGNFFPLPGFYVMGDQFKLYSPRLGASPGPKTGENDEDHIYREEQLESASMFDRSSSYHHA